MQPLELLAWGQLACQCARTHADSIVPDVPQMPGMEGDGFSSSAARERHGWLSLEARLDASIRAALLDDWRPLNWMWHELGDNI